MPVQSCHLLADMPAQWRGGDDLRGDARPSAYRLVQRSQDISTARRRRGEAHHHREVEAVLPDHDSEDTLKLILGAAAGIGIQIKRRYLAD